MPSNFCKAQKAISVGIKDSVQEVHLPFTDLPLPDGLPNQVHEIFPAYGLSFRPLASKIPTGVLQGRHDVFQIIYVMGEQVMQCPDIIDSVLSPGIRVESPVCIPARVKNETLSF